MIKIKYDILILKKNKKWKNEKILIKYNMIGIIIVNIKIKKIKIIKK